MDKITLVLAIALAGCGGGSGPHGTTFPTDGGGGGQPDLTVVNPGGGDDLAMMNQGTDDSGMNNGGMDAGCKPPSTLHPPQMGKASIYCPFAGANGKGAYCQQGQQHCCEPSMGTSMCSPLATACPTGTTDWQCQDPSDCGNGKKCCGIGMLVIAPQGCQNYATKFKGTHCASSCTATEIEMCTSDGECGGKTCIPFATKAAQVGGCM